MKDKYISYYDSPVGKLVLTSNGEYLTGLYFDNCTEKIIDNSYKEKDLEIFKTTRTWLDKYFKGENPNPKEIPIYMEGSDFSMKVWKILKTIPYGSLVTYGDIAKKLGVNMSAQAVGHAVGVNPISIIVPCHRVIGTNRNLTGYGGGIDKKIKLLQIEGIYTDNLKIPKIYSNMP